jgi:uncharacterized protein HemY
MAKGGPGVASWKREWIRPEKRVRASIQEKINRANRLVERAADAKSEQRLRYLQGASQIVARVKSDLDATEGVDKLLKQIGELQARISELL